MTTRPSADAQTLIQHYRNLVGALLEHAELDHEGTEYAIGDFVDSDDCAAPILRLIIERQEGEEDR